MISQDLIIRAKEHVNESSQNRDTDYFCTTRDIFQARLDSFVLKSGKYMESALIGEIGNNTFDHNWNYADGKMRGAYFNLSFDENLVVLADYGRGIRDSLSNVIKLTDDLSAVETGFTKQISGRMPEQRGNGLKFVANTIVEKKWDFYFQSGNGCCRICDGKIDFYTADNLFSGCLAIFNFNGAML